MDNNFIALLLSDGYNFDNFHNFLNIIKHAKPVESQFPLREIIGSEFLAISGWNCWLKSKSALYFIREELLFKFAERLEIFFGFDGVDDFVHKRIIIRN